MPSPPSNAGFVGLFSGVWLLLRRYDLGSVVVFRWAEIWASVAALGMWWRFGISAVVGAVSCSGLKALGFAV